MYNRHWIITVIEHGFKYPLMFYGTEEELLAYLKTEVPNYVSYSGATDAEYNAMKTLRMHSYFLSDIKGR